MDISVAWIRSLAPTISAPAEELARQLSLQAVPVDRLEALGEGLDDVVVARVLRVEEHPNADRLTLCQVDAGGEPLEVVCGAPNVVEGALYPFIAPGGCLPGGFVIEQRKIRGVVSNGMLCSEVELGIGRDSDGILRLDDGHEVGAPIAQALALPDNRLLLDLTPNRVDLACHVGVARELAPGGVADITLASFGEAWNPAWTDGKDSASAAGVKVSIDDDSRCYRYLAGVVRGVRVGPSPDWLKARLRATGARPINNIVDATNYVLLELNQPLHAFDLALVEGQEIRVRAANTGEALVTLDGTHHDLESTATVIADASKPIALAGVMGGANSEVSDVTTDVLVECAWFDPGHTRSTASQAGVSTDASYRFERGIDERGMGMALQRCVELIVAVAGGTADAAAIRVGRPEGPPSVVGLRPGQVKRILGLRLSAEQILGLLRPIGFEVVAGSEEGSETELQIRVPSWRSDVQREADLLEEVARCYGYDRFPSESRSFRPSTVPDDPIWGKRETIARFLSARGLLEARGLPMVAASMAREDHIALLHPLSATEAVLRTDLVPPLIERIEHNFARGHRAVRLFEIGTVFRQDSKSESGGEGREAYVEDLRVGLVITGRRQPEHWSSVGEDADFWDLRGLVEQLADLLPGVELRTGQPETDEPGFGFGRWLGEDRIAMFSGEELVGAAGQVRPDAVDGPPWAGAVFAAEFRLSAVGIGDARRYEKLPTYPSSSRDVALWLPQGVTAAAVEQVIGKAGSAELVLVRPFDVYEADDVAGGRRSIAWRLVFRATDRTLTDAEIEADVASIVRKLREELDVRVRES